MIEKRARVTGEVEVGRRSAERTETVRDTVRHTEVDVDRGENASAGERERDRATTDRGSKGTTRDTPE